MKNLFLLILSLFVFSCNSSGGKADNNCSLNDDCLLLIGEWTGVTEDYDFDGSKIYS